MEKYFSFFCIWSLLTTLLLSGILSYFINESSLLEDSLAGGILGVTFGFE